MQTPLAAVLAVCWPLARRQQAVRSGTDVAVYRDQLGEIDRDEAASLIGGVEAEAARVEVSRRLIAAVETAKAATAVATPVPAASYRRATLAATIILLPLGACLTYLSLGSPNRCMGLFAVIWALVCSTASCGMDFSRMPVSIASTTT